MKRLIEKLGSWFARLASWRKPVAAPAQEQTETQPPKTTQARRPPAAEASQATEPPAPKLVWFARLKRALRWRGKAAAESAIDPDHTVVIARPSQEQLEATDALEDVPAAKTSLLTRLRNKFHREPMLEPLEGTLEEAEPSAAKRNRATDLDHENAEDQSDAEDVPKIGFLKRLLAMLCNKWVWIPTVSVIVLSLIGSVLFIVLHTAQEKEKLQAELQATQKKLEKQAALIKQAAVVAVAPPTTLAAANIGRTTSESKPGINPGDCLVTNKESVAKNLKECIDNFNQSHPANRKP